MLKESDIEQFYKDVEALDLKFPVAAIAKATGARKGNVSDYLNRRKEPSENFIKKFYDNFPRSTKKEQKQVELQDQLPLGNLNITLQDYLNEVRQQKEFLQQLLMDKVGKIDANLSTALGGVIQLSLHVESAREVVLKSLARLEKKPEASLTDEADKIVTQLMKEQQKQRSSSGDRR